MAADIGLEGSTLVTGYLRFGTVYGGITLTSPCGCDNLHQESIEFFSRSEDSDKGFHVIAGDGKQLTVNDSMVGNPSSRRGGIKITFSCEDSNNKPVLNIVQHKGNTLMFWDKGK